MSIAIKQADISDYTIVEVIEQGETQVVPENAGAVLIVKGEKGDPFEYEDFTEEQLEELKGEPGDDYVLTEEDKKEIAEMIPGGGNTEVTAESIEAALGYVPANPTAIPTKTSQLDNDSEFVKQEDIEEYAQPKGEYATKEEIPTVPTNVSAFANDAGYAKQSDIPTVPTKVSAFENDANYAKKSELPAVLVQSVNGKTGAVQLTAEDVGAKSEDYAPTYEDVGAEKAGAVAEHNVDPDSHNDIRIELTALRNALEAFLDIDDPTLDQLSELIQKIEANAGTITELTNGKVNVTDIVDNLTTNVANKPLSAAQGVALKGLVDSLTTVANNAANTAGTAKTTAEEAKTNAANAVNTANSASDVAQGASDKVNDLEKRMDSGELKGEKGDPGKTAYESARDGGYTGTEEEFNATLAGVSGILVTLPVFDLGALGLTAIPIAGGSKTIETDTTEIQAAFEKGEVGFIIPVDVGGQTMNATIVMNPASANGSYQGIALVNFTELATVTVTVNTGVIYVEVAAIKADAEIKTATEVDLTGFETNGIITETYEDGTENTYTFTYDETTDNTTITDSNGNSTVVKGMKDGNIELNEALDEINGESI